MSLFQCEHCGCMENTAFSPLGNVFSDLYDWKGIEDREGKKLCSACGPSKLNNGSDTKFGKWHGKFNRVFLPKDMFFTNSVGNLQHKENGDEDFRKYEVNDDET